MTTNYYSLYLISEIDYYDTTFNHPTTLINLNSIVVPLASTSTSLGVWLSKFKVLYTSSRDTHPTCTVMFPPG